MEAYCLKCKEKREIKDHVASYSANGRPITLGYCSVCNTKIAKFGLTDAHAGLEKPALTVSSKKTGGDSKTKNTKKKSKTARSAKKQETGASVKHASSVGKSLVIVESPAKANTIGKFLGKEYLVTASVGHIRDLLKSQLSVDVENDFAPKYRVPNEKKEVVKTLTKLAAASKKVYLATDPDREGESIAWHIMDSVQIPPEKTERVVFHEITKEAIAESFGHPRTVDMDLVDAQQARRVLDRLVGYSVSPILWKKVRKGLSAGRVQSVALRLIVEREREILDFEPIEYWKISAEFLPEGGKQTYTAQLAKVNGQNPELPDENTTNQVVADLQQSTYKLDKITKTERKVRPSAPFITSTLQQDASRQLGFPIKKTMMLAQQLYEGIDIGNGGATGLITYMRTDSVHVAPQAIQDARKYVTEQFGSGFVPEKIPHYRTRAASAQEAHEAIRPTSVFHDPSSIKKHLTNDQFRLYKLIWQRFIASQMKPAVIEITTINVVGKSQEHKYLFKASTSKTLFLGFRVVYHESIDEDKPEYDDMVDLPLKDLVEGQIQLLKNLTPSQHFTQPPPRFSEASLIQVLEENKIGRPSTYSPIISTIQARGYVTMEEKRLVPTETGFLVNDLVVEYFPTIVDVGFTSDLEEKLDEIADGKMHWVEVMREFYDPFEKSLKHAQENMPVNKIEPEKIGRACPQCGHDLVLRDGKYGKFISCSNFPACRYTEPWLDKIGVTCPVCKEGDVIRKKTRKGRVFYGCSRYPECTFTSWNPPLAEPCPNCGGILEQVNGQRSRCQTCHHTFKVSKEAPVED